MPALPEMFEPLLSHSGSTTHSLFSPSTYKPKRSVPRGSFSIKWSMESSLNSRRSLENCGIDIWTGVLSFYSFSPSSDDEKEIGSIRCYKIATCDVLPTSEYPYVFDCHAQELADFSRILDKDGVIRGNVRCDVGDPHEISYCGTKLFIKEVIVNPEFRGLGLGLFMVDEACRKLNDHMSLTVLQPAPLNSHSADNWDVAVSKLRRYYGLLGFRALGDSYVGRWNGNVLPDLQIVCPYLFH